MRALTQNKLWFIGNILLILCIGRMLLPYFAREYINDRLEEVQGYSGHVAEVSLSLLAGKVSLYDIRLQKDQPEGIRPIINLKSATLKLDWNGLLHGHLETQIFLDSPNLHFVVKKPQVPAPEITPVQAWQMGMQQLLPLKIDAVTISNGTVHYEDRQKQPIFDITLTQIQAKLQGLQKIATAQQPLPAELTLTAQAFNQADFDFNLQFNPRANTPTFKLEAQLENLHMQNMNDFLNRYTKLKAKQGDFSFYLEAAAKQGKITGYIKPFLQGLETKVPQQDQNNILKKAYSGAVQAANNILQNNDTEQVATKLDIGGDINQPDASLWSTIVNLLQNAFLKALLPGVDHSIKL